MIKNFIDFVNENVENIENQLAPEIKEWLITELKNWARTWIEAIGINDEDDENEADLGYETVMDLANKIENNELTDDVCSETIFHLSQIFDEDINDGTMEIPNTGGDIPLDEFVNIVTDIYNSIEK